MDQDVGNDQAGYPPQTGLDKLLTRSPPPALRATFSRREKGTRKASLRDFHASFGGVPIRLQRPLTRSWIGVRSGR
jgi:hypothetical protein